MVRSLFHRLVIFSGTLLSRAETKKVVENVSLPFVVPHTGRNYTVVALDAKASRKAFPGEDIFVTALRFKGLEVNGEEVMFHMRDEMLRREGKTTLHRPPEGFPTLNGETLALRLTNDIVTPERNHHPSAGTIYENHPMQAILSPGFYWAYPPFTSGSTNDFVFHHSVIHQGTSGSGFGHDHAAISYGTVKKENRFEPYGIRLRPQSPIFSCLHARYRQLAHTSVSRSRRW